MTCSNTHRLALLLFFIAFIACAQARPDAPEGFEEMDWTWLPSMGGQFTDMIANEQFARMTTAPMIGSARSRPLRRPIAHPQYQPRSQPAQDTTVVEESGGLLPWATDTTATMGVGQDMASSHQHAAVAQAPTFGPGQFQLSNNAQLNDSGNGQPWWEMGNDNIQAVPLPSVSQEEATPRVSQSESAFMPTNSTIANEPRASTTNPYGWLPVQQEQELAGVGQFNYQEYDFGQAHPAQPETMGLSSRQLEGYFGSSGSIVPDILSSDVTNNFNYQQAMSMSPAGSMMGWIGRAPTTGDRAVPRLDTNHLAPPEITSSTRSPTSASTTGSSDRQVCSRLGAWPTASSGEWVCHWCSLGFPTQSELTHHLRSHQPYLSRQHVCQHCSKRFQYRKDLARHLPKHDPHRKKFFCSIANCKYHIKGFGRLDHLERHTATQHRVDSPLRNRSPATGTRM